MYGNVTFHSVTTRNFIKFLDDRIQLDYLGSDINWHYLLSKIKVVKGLSGTPVYNSHGEFIGLISSMLGYHIINFDDTSIPYNVDDSYTIIRIANKSPTINERFYLHSDEFQSKHYEPFFSPEPLSINMTVENQNQYLSFSDNKILLGSTIYTTDNVVYPNIFFFELTRLDPSAGFSENFKQTAKNLGKSLSGFEETLMKNLEIKLHPDYHWLIPYVQAIPMAELLLILFVLVLAHGTNSMINFSKKGEIGQVCFNLAISVLSIFYISLLCLSLNAISIGSAILIGALFAYLFAAQYKENFKHIDRHSFESIDKLNLFMGTIIFLLILRIYDVPYVTEAFDLSFGKLVNATVAVKDSIKHSDLSNIKVMAYTSAENLLASPKWTNFVVLYDNMKSFSQAVLSKKGSQYFLDSSLCDWYLRPPIFISNLLSFFIAMVYNLSYYRYSSVWMNTEHDTTPAKNAKKFGDLTMLILGPFLTHVEGFKVVVLMLLGVFLGSFFSTLCAWFVSNAIILLCVHMANKPLGKLFATLTTVRNDESMVRISASIPTSSVITASILNLISVICIILSIITLNFFQASIIAIKYVLHLVSFDNDFFNSFMFSVENSLMSFLMTVLNIIGWKFLTNKQPTNVRKTAESYTTAAGTQALTAPII